MAVNMLLGLQWGDEGKGKIVDVLTKQYDIIARFQGGPNAGHTLIFDGHKHVLHTIPSGIFHENTLNVIGNGVVIDPVILQKELEKLTAFGVDFLEKLLVSRKAHIILPTHRLLDKVSETSKGEAKIGSTLKGIGPTYTDKISRSGLRVGDLQQENWEEKYRRLAKEHLSKLAFYDVDYSDFDLEKEEKIFFEAVSYLKKLTFIDSELYFQKAIKEGKKILAEGAQGSLLDIDFGTYPFVTSSNTVAAGGCTGLGIAPNKMDKVFGIFKAYTTRVGSGPFPTEIDDDYGKAMAKVGHEFGATTGRPRRCGWLDLVALKYSVLINGVTDLMMMKADVLSGFDTIKVCTAYKYKGEIIDYFPYNIDTEFLEPIYTDFNGWTEDLTQFTKESEFPKELNEYIAFLEKETEVKISIVSVGPDRKQTIFR